MGGRKEKNIDGPLDVTLPADIQEAFGFTQEGWEAAIISKQRRKVAVEDAATTSNQGRNETVEDRRVRMRMEEEAQEKDDQETLFCDYEGFRREWNTIWSRFYGSFEDTTRIPAMRFTCKPPPTNALVRPLQTLQIVSAKVAETRGGLQWPLDVFGFIAIRDQVITEILSSTAQGTIAKPLTQEDHNLVLVGPTRAIVLGNMVPVTIEIDLKLKGSTESEDKSLSFLAVPFLCDYSYKSQLINCAYTSNLSKLEFTLGRIVKSVEATIFMRIIRGSWPDGLCGEFAALTTDVCGKNTVCTNNAASIDQEKIVLLDSRGEKVPAASDGNINLSRHVVSVGIEGELKISVKVWKIDNVAMLKEEVFTPLKAGLSYGELDFSFCAVEVNVAWSLISEDPVSVNCPISEVVPVK